MRVLRIVLPLVGAALAGMLAGAAVGYGIGVWMAPGYRPYGAMDPRDVPFYFTLGVAIISALAGGAVGVLAVSIRLWPRLRMLRIALLLLGAALVGTLAGAVVGYSIGMWMARDYDVILGLAIVLAKIGGVIGVLTASIRLWRRSKKISPVNAV